MSTPSDITTALQTALTAAQSLVGYSLDKQAAVEGAIQQAITQVNAHLAQQVDQ